MALTEFYNDLANLDKVDWDVMKSKYWFDSEDYPNRKRRRQAEFLVYQQVELELFLGIGVCNKYMEEKVKNMLKESHIDMKVLVKPDFYY